MTSPSSLLSKVEAGVAWITLNRPEQRNALDIPSLKQLHALLEAFNTDPAVRVVVLTGTGRSFCAGADLAEWAEAGVRGEIVVVVAGAPARDADPETALKQVLALVADGMRLKDAAAEVAEATGLGRRDLYQAALERRR